MGFFSSLTKSYSKSKKIKSLQEIIAPPLDPSNDIVSWAKDRMSEGSSKRDKALEEFFELCEADENISKIIKQYGLGRENIKNIYQQLDSHGLGWVKSHYIPLSTIAYGEPLVYVIEANRRGINWGDIVLNILHYWDGRIPQGQLLKIIR